MLICNPEHCFGCQVCRVSCPMAAIDIQPDEKGFLRPVIDRDKCNECGLCVKLCPAGTRTIENKNLFVPKVYAAWLRDKKIRLKSTSGGMFYAIADYVLAREGVVFGAKWTSDWRVVHDYCSDKNGLADFFGSKYVQSDIGESYPIAKRNLEMGKIVLFSGTPCQIAGLKAFLRKPYNNLVCVDLICHGVPSHAVFKKYIQFIERTNNDKITDIKLRYKSPSWSSCSVKISFEHVKPYLVNVLSDSYSVGFTKGLFLRDSCYKCQYSTLGRQGDITIADFWGYQPSGWKFVDYDKGCSLLMLNSELGKKIFNAISEKLMFEEKTIQDAIRGNQSLQKPFPKGAHAAEFWRDFLDGKDFETIAEKYFIPGEVPNMGLIYKLKHQFRFLFPEWLFTITKKLLGKKS
ncbi:MAG: Coenzyme F420 hydrogenase/dehydrogenase, beta subunit C-terminal domain [Victivallaceae bacterium]|nr:Coenzyme F420 hydrogenase/dehydrogenase, beta subunit C-terminal domain [Victivallaceae bacterium]